MSLTSTAHKGKAIVSSGVERERIKRTESWARLLDDVIGTQDSIRGRVAIREKAFRFYRKFIALNATDRYLLLNGLEETCNDAARTLLEKALISDTNVIVRHKAAYCLGAVGDNTSIPVLRHALLNDDSHLVRHGAALSLAEIGTEEDFEYLYRGTMDDNHDVVVSCQIAQEILLNRLAGNKYQNTREELLNIKL